MAAKLIEEDPELAHEHALAASRRAGRIAIVRETLGITAYATGDFALALRELRTYRRISGKEDQIALMVDSERGVGRPDRALEAGRAVDRSALPVDVRVALAIAMSGARLDRGETELALGELEIPELDPDRAFSWSPALFAARAAVLEDLGRNEEAEFWAQRAEVALEALGLDEEGDEELIVEDSLIEGEFPEDSAAEETAAAPTESAVVEADATESEAAPEPEEADELDAAEAAPETETALEQDAADDSASAFEPAVESVAEAMPASDAQTEIEPAADLEPAAAVDPAPSEREQIEQEVAELLGESDEDTDANRDAEDEEDRA
ncbi:hypothetical protein M2317_003273 [Microbacterium sp. ZKA21]|uniref:hypothetical protein n=1 Tax=Microbacterium sp. ZKA21 TaxID=3381694 RepID=UPI003D19BC2D